MRWSYHGIDIALAYDMMNITYRDAAEAILASGTGTLELALRAAVMALPELSTDSTTSEPCADQNSATARPARR